MKEYSFEEVIANIKNGETYKCTNDTYIIQTIQRDEIGLKFNNYQPLERCGINNIQRFVRVKTPVSFIEALESYNHNKTIKSIETKNRYKRTYDGRMIKVDNHGKWMNDVIGISFIELEGQWYVQEESEGKE